MGKSGSRVSYEDSDGKKHGFWKTRARVSPRATRFHDESEYSRKNLRRELQDELAELEAEKEEILRCEVTGELCGVDLVKTLDCDCRSCLLWQDRNGGLS